MQTHATALLLSLALSTGSANGYLQPTHEDMSAIAFEMADIWSDSVLITLTNFSRDQVSDFRSGARDEDNGSRPVHHFFNPLDGSGLLNFTNSPDWIIDGQRQPEDESFSYGVALRQYYSTLIGGNRAERAERGKVMFRTLGHIAHHIQDMAQPEHTRGDAHCDVKSCSLVGKYEPSMYENFVGRLDISRFRDFVSPVYSIRNPNPAVSGVRSFWASSDPNFGMSVISNRRFVTPDTNFRSMCGGTQTFCSSPGFPNPAAAESRIVERPNGKYVEHPAGSGRLISTVIPPSNNARVRFTSYALTEPNWILMSNELVPQAISYTTGFLNYFFRARLSARTINCHPRILVIHNLGPDLPKGKFEMWYEKLPTSRDRREKVKDWEFSVDSLASGAAVLTGLAVPEEAGTFPIIIFRPVDLASWTDKDLVAVGSAVLDNLC